MNVHEKKEVVQLLKILKKLNKNELQVLISNLSHDGVNKICEIFYNVIYKDIRPKNKLKIANLKKLMFKNRSNVEFLSRFSPKKKTIEEKKKVLQSGGFP